MGINNIKRFQAIFLYLLSIPILLLILIEILLGLTPPIARDALIHHLAIPKLWLMNGGFYEIKWADFSYYPMNVDLLYLIPLYFHNDIIPNFIHMSFGIGTALLIYHYLQNKISRIAGLLGVLVFLSTPIIMRMSTVAYVDLGLVFFTTASILSFVRWRKGEYKEFKWLFLCSIAMGLALGTKYNALIAWFFLSLTVVFIYSRDTGKQSKAIAYGLIFFLISLFVFSPWLIKNFILTGNPLFPLFKGFFNTGVNTLTPDSGMHSVVSGDTYMGMFKMREMLYDESFWNTLLIPIRFFFQGQDHSDRFFDGVLNPLLIILVPFAFMNSKNNSDKLLFVLFSAFFILTAFFLDQLRIRYFLPVIPLLSILSVIGIINILNWSTGKARPFKDLYVVALLCLLIILGARNVIYIYNYFQSLQPVPYVLHLETRDAYLKRHVKSYSATRYINDHTPQNSKIRLFLLAGRGYYLDRIYEDDPSFGMNIIHRLAATANSDKSFQIYLNSLDCTHLLINMDLLRQFLKINYPLETVNRFFQQLARTTAVIYHGDGYTVYRLIPCD